MTLYGVSFTPLAVVLLLSGCAHHPLDCAVGFAWADCLPGTAGYAAREPDADKCAGYGFTPGTNEYAQCNMQLDQQRMQERAQILNNMHH